MKEKIENVKKFVKKNEDALLLGVLVVATATVNHVASRAALNSLRVKRVDLDKSKERVRITYKNGDADYYHVNYPK